MPGKPKRSEKLSDFASRLNAEMRQWGVTQSTIAARLGVSQGTVSGWFNRSSMPQPRTLTGLAEMFGVTPQWLVDGSDPKLSEESQAAGKQLLKLNPPKDFRNSSLMVQLQSKLAGGRAGTAHLSTYEQLLEAIPIYWEEFMKEERPYMKSARMETFFCYVNELNDRIQNNRR